MDDSLQEKILETVVNTHLQHAFCRHVRVVERLCFCLTLKTLIIVYTIVTYIYVIYIVSIIIECFYLVFKLKKIYNNKFF